MAKKKKTKDEWVVFVNRILNRPRAKRDYKIPKAYILSISDQIWRTTPSRDIIINTLTEMYSTAYEKGYLRKGEDIAYFKAKQQKHLDAEFNQFKDEMDDRIHMSTNEQSK